MPSPPASRTSASAPVGSADSKYSKKVEQFISIPYPSISSDQHFQYLLCRRISLATAWSVMKCHESSWNILETYNHLILFSSCMAALPRTVTFTTSAEMPKATVKANSSNAKAWQSYCQVTFVSASQEMYSFELILLMRCDWLPLNTTWQRDSRDRHWSILESLARQASVVARSVLAQVEGELLKPAKTA